ncbi:hypothetical protein [Agromyces neolithicus]|uniref:DUF2510 domain-containing protein n=1 Tax=Agromyces neolithicus TaxID=269420 RepID=A0ABN2M0V8_9MICO
MSNAPADWYPNPTNRAWVRWWTGREWADAYWQVRATPRAYLSGAPRFDISSRSPTFDIVGEAYRDNEITAAIGQKPPRDREVEWFGTAELVPEPDSPLRREGDAIGVRINGHVVGYLANEELSEYAPVIHRFIRAGIVPTVDTRVWAVTRYVASRARDELKSAIRLSLPRAGELLPENEVPGVPYVILPRGRRVQVSGESDHLDVLTTFLRRKGRANVLVTLTPIEVPRARGTTTAVEVQIAGSRVGQLSPTMSANLLPFVREATDKGRVATAWASIVGTRLAAEVTLDIAKPELIPPSWPADADGPPPLTKVQELPAAYAPQEDISLPPSRRGLPTWILAVAVIGILIIGLIPYAGLPLMLIGGGLLIWWTIVARRMPPSGAKKSIERRQAAIPTVIR